MAQRLLVAVAAVVGTLLLFGSARAAPGPRWQGLTNSPPFNPGPMFLLTDGTVIVQDLGSTEAGSPNWWRLAPNSSGNYVDGTWSRLASLPAAYAPNDFAAAVLPDGRLAVAGGEYNNSVRADTNRGAIYDPLKNTWTTISHRPVGRATGPISAMRRVSCSPTAAGWSEPQAQPKPTTTRSSIRRR